MTVADHFYPQCCAYCKEDLGKHLCRSCDDSCDLDQGLLGKCCLCRDSSRSSGSCFLLENSSTSLCCWEAVSSSSHIPVGKHQWVLLQQEQPAPSALLVLGLVPYLKAKGGRFKEQKKWAFIPSSLRCLCESSHAKPSLWEPQQDLWPWTHMRLGSVQP